MPTNKISSIQKPTTELSRLFEDIYAADSAFTKRPKGLESSEPLALSLLNLDEASETNQKQREFSEEDKQYLMDRGVDLEKARKYSKELYPDIRAVRYLIRLGVPDEAANLDVYKQYAYDHNDVAALFHAGIVSQNKAKWQLDESIVKKYHKGWSGTSIASLHLLKTLTKNDPMNTYNANAHDDMSYKERKAYKAAPSPNYVAPMLTVQQITELQAMGINAEVSYGKIKALFKADYNLRTSDRVKLVTRAINPELYLKHKKALGDDASVSLVMSAATRELIDNRIEDLKIDKNDFYKLMKDQQGIHFFNREHAEVYIETYLNLKDPKRNAEGRTIVSQKSTSNPQAKIQGLDDPDQQTALEYGVHLLHGLVKVKHRVVYSEVYKEDQIVSNMNAAAKREQGPITYLLSTHGSKQGLFFQADGDETNTVARDDAGELIIGEQAKGSNLVVDACLSALGDKCIGEFLRDETGLPTYAQTGVGVLIKLNPKTLEPTFTGGKRFFK
ncbi:MAG: hypothetical protein HOA17_09040 [Candidatus Melainabacteria bacterium]|nr:hypothetical protein [Candidatus Melainabacteria bacterium]